MQAANRWVIKASDSLETVRVNPGGPTTKQWTSSANRPSIPSSDDPPGPPAVMAVLRLERTVGLGIVPLYNARKSTTFVQRSVTRSTSPVTRTPDKMLNRVLGLNPRERVRTSPTTWLTPWAVTPPR